MRPANIVEVPVQIPGTCLRCKCAKTPNREYFLDTGTDIDYVGVVYFCDKCLLDFVEKSPDCFTQREMNDVIDSNNELLTLASENVKDYADVKAALKAIGLDAADLLEKARKFREDQEKAPELRKELSVQKSELAAKEAQLKEVNSKLEALSEYVGAEKEIALLSNELTAVKAERDELLKEKDMFAETLDRVVAEAKEEISEADKELDQLDDMLAKAEASKSFVGLNIADVVVKKND